METLTRALYWLAYPLVRLIAGRGGASLGVRVIAVTPDRQVLLIRHTYMAGWHLPGGGIERGETAAEAAARELAEEGGLEASHPPTLLGLHLRKVWPAGDQIALYEVRHWTRCAPRANGEIAATAFFPLEHLPIDTEVRTARKLAEYRNGALTDRW